MSTLAASAAPTRRPFLGWRAQLRARRVLVAALVASLIVHVAASFFADDVDAPPEPAPLTAQLTEIPPPPVPAVAPAAPARAPAARPKPRRPATSHPRSLPTIAVEPEVAAQAPAAAESSAPTREAPAAATAEDPTPAPIAPLPSIEAPPPGKTLPPRIDLAYRVFIGTQGFEVGHAVYRFEHAEDRYRISTVGRARGLAALILRGQGRLESRGAITANGLVPHEFSVDRFSGKGHESARFDWSAMQVTLHENKTEPLEPPAFDPLSLMWQFYFTPPAIGMQTFSLATTKRVARYTIRRDGTEAIPWRGGNVEAERWVRTSDDGKTESIVWVAPSLRWLPVKMRVANTQRGTVEALLDGILVDESGERAGRDDYAFTLDAPTVAPATPSLEERTGVVAPTPGATFPSMTGQ